VCTWTTLQQHGHTRRASSSVHPLYPQQAQSPLTDALPLLPLLLSAPILPPADQKGKFDELIEEHGVRLLIDPAALMHVLGTTMDYIDEPLK
jgi:hypothetical protein